MTSHPFFSIIVPVYNSSHTLERCLESVLSQDFNDYEVICVDDGSSDSSWIVLEDYVSRDSRIRCYVMIVFGAISILCVLFIRKNKKKKEPIKK